MGRKVSFDKVYRATTLCCLQQNISLRPIWYILFCLRIERLAGSLELSRVHARNFAWGILKKLCELFVKRIDIAVRCAIMKWKK